uniref:Uncharacterized protein n=1 Tax=Rhodopseudomonas palustris (strain BisA53) TaxID=316055 RepID=Q07HG7_RHOP5
MASGAKVKPAPRHGVMRGSWGIRRRATGRHRESLTQYENNKIRHLSSSLRGAKRRSNPEFRAQRDGLLRFARNDGDRALICSLQPTKKRGVAAAFS